MKKIFFIVLLLAFMSILYADTPTITPTITITLTATWDTNIPTPTLTPTVNTIWLKALNNKARGAYTTNVFIKEFPVKKIIYKNKTTISPRYDYVVARKDLFYYFILSYAKQKGLTLNEVFSRLQTERDWETLIKLMKERGVL